MDGLPFLHELIAMAEEVHERIKANPIKGATVEERFVDVFKTHGYSMDWGMWEAACGIMRAAIGPEECDRYFKFPYPHLVAAAFAIEGRSGDGSNMALDFMDQWEEDHPQGIGCSAHCAGTCDDDTGYCGCVCTGTCHRTKAIRAAYERAGQTAFWLENFMDAAALAISKLQSGAP